MPQKSKMNAEEKVEMIRKYQQRGDNLCFLQRSICAERSLLRKYFQKAIYNFRHFY